MPMILVGNTGASSWTSGSAHRSPVNVIGPNGWSATAATVSASYGALGSPSTTPNEMPPDGRAKRAMRTALQATRRVGRRAAAGYWPGDVAPDPPWRGAAPRRARRSPAGRRRAAVADRRSASRPADRPPAAGRRGAGGRRHRASGVESKQAVADGVVQGQPGGLDDVRVHPDGGPLATAVAGLDEDPGDRVRPVSTVQDAHLVVGQLDGGQLRVERLQRAAQGPVQRVHRAVALAGGQQP